MGWLIVIDMQRIFEPHAQWGVPDYDRVAARIAPLLDRFAGRTVYTRFVAPAAPTRAWKDYYALYPGALLPADHAEWDISPALHRAGAPVVTATTMSKWSPRLARIVGDEPLYVAGVTTDCCIVSTCLAAADAGRRITVLEDACAGVTAATHDHAIKVLSLFRPMITIGDTASL